MNFEQIVKECHLNQMSIEIKPVENPEITMITLKKNVNKRILMEYFLVSSHHYRHIKDMISEGIFNLNNGIPVAIKSELENPKLKSKWRRVWELITGK